MKNRTHDDELMIKYLLGDLSEEEQVEIEQRFLKDPAYLEQLQALEAELNDEYVRGELGARDQERWAQRFSTSGEWRGRVDFARTLLSAGEHLPTMTTSQPKVRAASLRLQKPVLIWGLATAFLVVIVASSWLVLENSRLRGRLERMQAEQRTSEQQAQELQRQVAEQRLRGDQFAEQLQRENDQKQLSSVLKGSPALLSFILMPGAGRGIDPSTTLAIPPNTQLVGLRLYLEGANPYKSYRTELRTSDDKLVWSREGLAPQQTRQGQEVVLSLPAPILDAGGYEVTLQGVVAKGQTENVGYYSFTVSKK
jgi:hypothetical protein